MGRSAHLTVQTVGSNYLETLRRCGGYYECPKSEEGKRLGPIVGYAGKYVIGDKEKQFVGDVYCNFAKAEEFPSVLHHFAKGILGELQETGGLKPLLETTDVFCGAPIGGYSFADMLGLVFDRQAIKAEKKIITLATPALREQSVIVFNRHSPRLGDGVVVAEDVCNNFSTTEQLIALIEQSGAHVVAIMCLLNRSLTVDTEYAPKGSDRKIPVISLVRKPIQEYKQEDPEVSSDIAAGNVVLKPKNEWPQLMVAMEAAKK